MQVHDQVVDLADDDVDDADVLCEVAPSVLVAVVLVAVVVAVIVAEISIVVLKFLLPVVTSWRAPGLNLMMVIRVLVNKSFFSSDTCRTSLLTL